MSADRPPPGEPTSVATPLGPPPSARPANNGRRVFLAIVAVHAGLSLAFSLSTRIMHGWSTRELLFIAGVLGLPFSQVYLAVFWVAFSQRRAVVRLLVGAVLVFASWFFVFGLIGGQVPGEPVVPGIAMLVQFLVGVVLLAGVRAVARWRLSAVGDTGEAVPSTPLQFSIRHLLILTAVVSVVLAIARVTLANVSRPQGELVPFLLFVAFNVVLCFPVSLAMLVQRGCGWAMIASAIWTACLTPVEWMAFQVCGYGGQDTGFWWSVNGCLWGSLALTLVATRLAGWRLARFAASFIES